MASRPQKKAMKGAERAEKQWVDNVLLLSLNCLSEARKKGELYLQLPDLTDSIGHFSISHGSIAYLYFLRQSDLYNFSPLQSSGNF